MIATPTLIPESNQDTPCNEGRSRLGEYPTLFQTEGSSSTTDRYKPVATIDIINKFQDYGLQVRQVMGSRTGTKSSTHGAHAVRMINVGEQLPRNIGDSVPEVVILNSHNGQSRCRISMGLYRMVCSNGLVIGKDCLSYALTHVGDIQEEVFKAVGHIATQAPILGETISRWKERKLTNAEMMEFAKQARDLRFGSKKEDFESLSPTRIVRAQRYADAGDDLWTTFNRAQENLVRGGLGYVKFTEGTSRARHLKTRPLRSAKPLTEFNSKLWDLAGEFLLPN